MVSGKLWRSGGSNRPSFTTIQLYWDIGAPVDGPKGPSTLVVVISTTGMLGLYMYVDTWGWDYQGFWYVYVYPRGLCGFTYIDFNTVL